MKTYNSIIAAKYLLALANEKGAILNITKVQKLLYLVYGHFLAKYGYIIFDEAPKAWPSGPVFPNTRKTINYERVVRMDDPELSEIKQDVLLTSIFNDIIDKCSKYSATILKNWSHASGGPWSRTIKDEGYGEYTPIKREYIKEYFSHLAI